MNSKQRTQNNTLEPNGHKGNYRLAHWTIYTKNGFQSHETRTLGYFIKDSLVLMDEQLNFFKRKGIECMMIIFRYMSSFSGSINWFPEDTPTNMRMKYFIMQCYVNKYRYKYFGDLMIRQDDFCLPGRCPSC